MDWKFGVGDVVVHRSAARPADRERLVVVRRYAEDFGTGTALGYVCRSLGGSSGGAWRALSGRDDPTHFEGHFAECELDRPPADGSGLAAALALVEAEKDAAVAAARFDLASGLREVTDRLKRLVADP